MPRRITKYLAKPRQFMYLIALLIVSWLISGYFMFKDYYLASQIKSKRVERELYYSDHPRVVRDTRLSQKFFDVAFEMQTDNIVKDKTEGREVRMISVCATECRVKEGKDVCGDRCKMPLNLTETKDLCLKSLSTSRKFHKYRVYDCKFEVSLDGDHPLACTPFTWKVFKALCGALTDT